MKWEFKFLSYAGCRGMVRDFKDPEERDVQVREMSDFLANNI
jgi:hypothetical protein